LKVNYINCSNMHLAPSLATFFLVTIVTLIKLNLVVLLQLVIVFSTCGDWISICPSRFQSLMLMLHWRFWILQYIIKNWQKWMSVKKRGKGNWRGSVGLTVKMMVLTVVLKVKESKWKLVYSIFGEVKYKCYKHLYILIFTIGSFISHIQKLN